jgi:hypothetical protein
MITTRKELVDVFEALGFKMASKWANDRLLAKVAKLADVDTDSESVAGMGKAQRKLLASLIECAKAGDAIEIKTEGEPTKEEVAEQPKKFAKAAKKAASKDKGEKPAKAKKLKKIGRPAAIARFLAKSKKKRLTRDEIVEGGNAVYVDLGGKDNVKESTLYTGVVIPVLVEFGVIEIDGDTVKIV